MTAVISIFLITSDRLTFKIICSTVFFIKDLKTKHCQGMGIGLLRNGNLLFSIISQIVDKLRFCHFFLLLSTTGKSISWDILWNKDKLKSPSTITWRRLIVGRCVKNRKNFYKYFGKIWVNIYPNISVKFLWKLLKTCVVKVS